MRVKTDYEGCEYITAGKEYEATYNPEYPKCPDIVDDWGRECTAPLNCPSEHLDDEGTWEVIE